MLKTLTQIRERKIGKVMVSFSIVEVGVIVLFVGIIITGCVFTW